LCRESLGQHGIPAQRLVAMEYNDEHSTAPASNKRPKNGKIVLETKRLKRKTVETGLAQISP